MVNLRKSDAFILLSLQLSFPIFSSLLLSILFKSVSNSLLFLSSIFFFFFDAYFCQLEIENVNL